MEKQISQAVISRLPRYFRYLRELIRMGKTRVSSAELSKMMNLTASQIRQDFSCFGEFGQQGYGYNVEYLYGEIGAILGLNKGYTAILVGAGNIGKAFTTNTNFERRGFRLIGIFDKDPDKIGSTISTKERDLEVMDYKKVKGFIEKEAPTMAIIAVPRVSVSDVINELRSYGIKAFLNFSYTEVASSEDTVVENIHLGDSLMRLCFKISDKEDKE